MKKFALLVLFALPLCGFAEQLKVVIFTSPTCSHCAAMKKEFLPDFKKRFDGRVEFVEIDASDPQGSITFRDAADAYGRGYEVPAIAAGETYLLGYPQSIKTGADAAVEKALAGNEHTKVKIKEVKSGDVFNKLTFWTIVGAGLADGINPCAFAVIVFFVSFLAVYGYKERDIIFVGFAYCFAVFLTYFLLGFGVFTFIHAMSGFFYVLKAFYFLTAAVCLLFFCLSVYDLYIYQKTKKSDGMLLQLPKNLKVRINKIIGFFMRGDNGAKRGPLRITVAAFAVGFIVSLIEAACTGQVYVPTIVLIMKDPHFRLRAVSYLVLYNLLFIFPLLVVFAATVLGYKSEGVSNLLKKHLGLTKLALALVFLGLFLLMLLS